ncbi:hypothetical protein [Paenibacillus timonensis]|uniref:hypothetical protein n=1 Tax=Paenibacillus timonensis TaxID=225915 RepID=UPI003F986A81
MDSVQKLIIKRLKVEFEQNSKNGDGTVWIMLVSSKSLNEVEESHSHITEGYTPYMNTNTPAGTEHIHVVRTVLRTSDLQGINPYVDGTDIFMSVNVENHTAELIWEDLWAEGPPIFHGGTIDAAHSWVRDLSEPFYVQFDDPHLVL